MKKIDNRADFEQAINFYESLRSYNFNYETEIKKLPERLRQFIKEERAVFPKHLDIRLFKELLIKELTALQPRYKTDETAIKTIDLICQYAVRDSRFLTNENFSFGKGLLIMGKVGCGKTLIFKGLIDLLKKFVSLDQGGHFVKIDANYIPAYTITETFVKIGFDIFTQGIPDDKFGKQFLMRDGLFVDDIGAENIVTNFGNTTNVLGEIFLRRYDKGLKTFATTNFDPKTLKQFYGERVYSRITEMMNFITMDGGDRRK